MKIPNGDRAELGTKVEDYSVNPLHRQGQHKARVFESVLGITLANANVLRTALLHAAANSEDAVHNGITDMAICMNFVFLSRRQKRRQRSSVPGLSATVRISRG